MSFDSKKKEEDHTSVQADRLRKLEELSREINKGWHGATSKRTMKDIIAAKRIIKYSELLR